MHLRPIGLGTQRNLGVVFVYWFADFESSKVKEEKQKAACADSAEQTSKQPVCLLLRHFAWRSLHTGDVR